MIVCICHRVSDRDIAQAAREGCASFDDLQFELLVATACGACHDCARQTFEAHAGAPMWVEAPALEPSTLAAAAHPHHGVRRGETATEAHV